MAIMKIELKGIFLKLMFKIRKNSIAVTTIYIFLPGIKCILYFLYLKTICASDTESWLLEM